jgi:membrane associated rhomboid family serine protease
VLLAVERRIARPLVTGSVWVLTAVMAVWQTLDPSVLDALRRDPAAVGRGEWWRVLSPLLVQSDGWPQIVGNLVFLAIIGYFAERRFGRVRWVVLYLTGGIVGEAAGYAFEPHGAGNSVAIFGLVGGLLAAAAREHRPAVAAAVRVSAAPGVSAAPAVSAAAAVSAAPAVSGVAGVSPVAAGVSPVAVVAGLAWIASVVGLDLGGYVWAAVASSLVIVFATQVARRFPDPSKLYRPAAVLAAALAVLLISIADDHGFPILAGLAVGALLVKSAGPRPAKSTGLRPVKREEH